MDSMQSGLAGNADSWLDRVGCGNQVRGAGRRWPPGDAKLRNRSTGPDEHPDNCAEQDRADQHDDHVAWPNWSRGWRRAAAARTSATTDRPYGARRYRWRAGRPSGRSPTPTATPVG